jgi:hypothetical protein
VFPEKLARLAGWQKIAVILRHDVESKAGLHKCRSFDAIGTGSWIPLFLSFYPPKKVTGFQPN